MTEAQQGALELVKADLAWIAGYAELMTADNWRDMKLHIERQAASASKMLAKATTKTS